MFKELLERIATGLDSEDIPYMIIGGQAVLLYGEPRLTRDIDITIGLGVEESERIISLALKLDLRPLVPEPEDFIQKTFVLPAIDEGSGIRVDFIFSHSSYEKQAIKRGARIRMGKARVNFASLEDIVIHKVIAGRPRDIEDIKTIMIKNPSRDEDYILEWLEEFDQALDEDFSGTFEKILEEIL